MQPEPQAMLELIAHKIIVDLMPQVGDYLKGDLRMLAETIRAAAERFDVEAEVLVREHRGMEEIFAKARRHADLRDFVTAQAIAVDGLRVSSLRARNRAELAALGALDAGLERLPGPPGDLRADIDAFLQARCTLQAFRVGPYPTPGLAERQEEALR
jgi:hypothetical protein